MNTWISFLNAAIIQGIPLLYGATGEIITEKSGNLNLGIPGIMYVGGISGIIGGSLYEHGCRTAGTTPAAALCILIPFLSCLLGSALMALIYSFLTVTLRANQNVTGLALTTFGVGVGNFFGGSLLRFFGESGSISLLATGTYYKTALPFAKNLGWVGKLFFSYGFLAYLAGDSGGHFPDPVARCLESACGWRASRDRGRCWHQRDGIQVLGHHSRRHDCGAWRFVLRHGLHGWRMDEQRFR